MGRLRLLVDIEPKHVWLLLLLGTKVVLLWWIIWLRLHEPKVALLILLLLLHLWLANSSWSRAKEIY